MVTSLSKIFGHFEFAPTLFLLFYIYILSKEEAEDCLRKNCQRLEGVMLEFTANRGRLQDSG